MKKIFILLVSSLLILSSCKENVKAQVDDKTDIVQEDEVNNLNDTELNSAAAYYNRGLSKYNLKDYYGAISDLTKDIEINPNDAEAYNNLGSVLNSLDKIEEAEKNFKKAYFFIYLWNEISF